MKIFVFKTGSKLVPSTSEDKYKIAKMPKGEPFEIEWKRQRNPKFHRKFFALMQFAWDNKPESMDSYFPTSKNVPDEFRKEIIKRAGYYVEHTNFKGVKEYRAKSISFANMSEDEFEELYSACIDVIIKYMNIPDEVFKSEWMEFMH